MNVISLNTLILNTLLVIYKSRCYSNLLFTSHDTIAYIFFFHKIFKTICTYPPLVGDRSQRKNCPKNPKPSEEPRFSGLMAKKPLCDYINIEYKQLVQYKI